MLLLTLLMAASPGSAEMLVAPPGCFDAAWTRMRFGQTLERAAAAAGGRARPLDISLQALSLDGAVWLPSPPFADADEVPRFVTAAREQPLAQTLLGEVVIVESPWELAFASPSPRTRRRSCG